jgi:hypothetical protein
MRISDMSAESALVRYPGDCKGKYAQIGKTPRRVLSVGRDG